MASLSCGIYAVVFLKLWSYVQVNHWCRTATLNRPKTLAKQRHQSFSMADLNTAPLAQKAAAAITSNIYTNDS